MASTVTALTSGGGIALSGDTSGSLQLQTNNGTTAMTIDTSQNVGIGISTPLGKFAVNNTGTGQVGFNAGTLASPVRGNLWYDTDGTGWQFQIGKYQSSVFTAQMTITDSGNLLVGTTSQVNGTSRIVSVSPSTSSTAIGGWIANGATAAVYNSASPTTAGTGWYHLVCQSGNGSSITANNLFIYGNGNVQNANNSYGAISDIKLKENIVDATPKLEDLCKVKIRQYNLIGDYEKHKQLGVVAQELEQVFPAMVEENADKDFEGNDLGTTTKSVKYSVFVPMLIKAIQEQQAIITDLKARIETLEGAKA